MRRNTNRQGVSDAGVETGSVWRKAGRHSFNFDSLSPEQSGVPRKRFLPERVLCSLSAVIASTAGLTSALEARLLRRRRRSQPSCTPKLDTREVGPQPLPCGQQQPPERRGRYPHSENKETVRPCSRWESICRPTGEGTEQEKSKTDLLNRERSNATVLKSPRKQTSLGLVKPSGALQAVKLLPRRIAECWKQHGYRQRDHLLSTNTRYFPLNGGSSAVFKPLSTQDHSLPTKRI